MSVLSRHRPKGRLARFSSDQRGSTAVEFGIVVVPFLGILFATMQTGYVYFAQEGLNAAIAGAGRPILTGQAQGTGYTDATSFRNAVICPTSSTTFTRMLPSFMNCADLIIDVRVATSFSSADTSAAYYASSPQFNMGGACDIVVMRVIYPLPVLMPILSATSIGKPVVTTGGQTNYTSASGVVGMKYLLMSTAVFRNEPFNATSTSCSS